MKFIDKTAVVTGGASGIGRATALRFAAEGAKVVVADVQFDAGAQTVAMIRSSGGEAKFVGADVSSAEAARSLIERAVDSYGRIHFAFNNAGVFSPPSRLADYEESEWDRTLAINLKGVWACMKYELLHMAEHGGGAIVNTSSVAALAGTELYGAYAASKAGVLQLSRIAALEYAADGIRVNAICPGGTRTQMFAEILEARPDVTEAQFASMAPMARISDPSEIAAAVVWLCSDEASFVTGISMPIDGGMTAR
jgi:NAD(P)-dependent dehydrogenase (short-subunit alcohol dehydrogenase family)